MRFLVIGSGGREHALAWRLSSSRSCEALFCLPGNGGTGAIAENVAIDVNDSQQIIEFARRENIDFVVIGPEQPLVNGLAEWLREQGIAALGPSARAAELEGSKAFAKQFCQQFGIPCADSRSFTCAEAAKTHIAEKGETPIVIKADGLAAGKGVVVATSIAQAQNYVDDLMGGAFGDAGRIVVVENYLEGEEISFFALCDGLQALPLMAIKDHKRAYDNDEGPNTGGMGAYGSANLISPALQNEIMQKILYPTLHGMQELGRPYSGVLFLGLMLCHDGVKLIEYNVRFGDPECQVMMMLLRSDLAEIFSVYTQHGLGELELNWDPRTALAVVLAAQGYPGPFDTGLPIGKADKLAALATPLQQIFHAATQLHNDNQLYSSGGRILNVLALGDDIAQARKQAYDSINKLSFKGGFYRHDIGDS